MKNKETVKFQNQTINISSIVNMNYNDQCELLKIKGNAIQYLENATLEQQLIAVKQNGYAIRHIKNPSYDVQKQAYTTSPTAVQFVDEPNKELLMQAFEKDPNVLQFIKNPTYQQKVSAVSRKGATIQYIKSPTAELIDIALNQNPMAIGHLQKPENSFVIKAIDSNPKSIKNIINKLPRNLVVKALEKKGYLIKYIKNPDDELIKIAISSQPSAIQYITQPSIETQIVAIKKSPNLIDCVNTDIEEVQIAAVESKPDNIYKITSPTSKTIQSFNKTEIQNNKKAKKELRNNIPPSFHYKIIHKYQEYIKNELLLNEKCCFINQYNESLSDIIKAICSIIKVNSIHIATGYLFRSGINELNSLIVPVINRSGTIELIVGSLQHYYDDTIIESMDFETAKYLKGLLNLNSIYLATYTDTFYHGKFYKLKSNDFTCIIIGSSNVSKSGLNGNSELNQIAIFKNSSEDLKMFEEWLDNFKSSCRTINSINLSKFTNRINDKDVSLSQDIGRNLDIVNFTKFTKQIKNINTKERMDIWLSHKPTKIYDNLTLPPFEEYILFVYEELNLYVFESFDFGNAFYCFKSNSIDSLFKSIKGKTKLQLYKTSEFYKRGYHRDDILNMKIYIASLF